MKKLLLAKLLLILIINLTQAQSLNTITIRAKNSQYCNPLTAYFTISGNTISKYDEDSNLISEYYSKLDQTDFDARGYYVETYSPAFVLDDYGVDVYNRVDKFAYKIVYDKRGGNLIYIFEYNIKVGIEYGKFYFSEKGTELICKN